MLNELSRRTGVERLRFEALMARHGSGVGQPAEAEVAPASAAPTAVKEAGVAARPDRVPVGLVARILQLLVHEPILVERLPDAEDWYPEGDPDVPLCREVVRLLRAGRYRSGQVLLAHFHGSDQGQRLAALVKREMLIPRDARAQELDGLVEHFRRRQMRPSCQEQIDALLAKQRSGERLSPEERQRLMALLAELGS
jgi:DNA primase